jgi:hypothetical protein
VAGYFCLCIAAGCAAIVQWGVRKTADRTPEAVRFRQTTILRPRVREIPCRLARLPGNQSLQLELQELRLKVPRLDPALEGLSVIHLADFHFTGGIGRSYFEEIVGLCNRLDGDLVAVTGDIVDKPQRIDWIPETLGKLRARWGVYFVLGNHDMWNAPERIRRTMTECGLVDLAGRWSETAIRARPVILAGNEAPWGPAADLTRVSPPSDNGPLRIVLSHSPDQFPWARANHVDLMLAGHTHGGQFRIPFIGPFVSPSRYGVRYASGTFYARPTLMHVSRGVSAKFPLRIHCRPEVTKLTLLAPESPARERAQRATPAIAGS